MRRACDLPWLSPQHTFQTMAQGRGTQEEHGSRGSRDKNSFLKTGRMRQLEFVGPYSGHEN
jgi:hypothetical protein